MTSKLTRERIELIANFHRAMTLPPSHAEIEELARMALAAMDSEPVAYIFKHPAGRLFWSLTDKSNKGHDDVIPVYASPQPAQVVPELMVDWQENEFSAGWNACRAAMLQELKKSAGAEAICRSDENVQVLHTKSPAQSDCCPAQNVVAPAQSPIDHGYLPECECAGCKATARICTEMAVNSLVIPDEMTSGQAYEIGYYYGDPVDVFARGANWMRQHIIDSTLAAAPQSPGIEPATVPGKWIPVSERMPEDRTQVILWDAEIGEVTSGHYSHKTQTFYHCGDAIENEITHWMLPPSAPQEVKP